MFDADGKGVQIRVPATANLMIDSADRDAARESPFDFQINRPQSILNGFFNRIGTTEVVLEWSEPNGAYISSLGPTQMIVSSSAGLVSTVATSGTGPLLFYNASNALDSFVRGLNSLSTTTATSSFFISTNVTGGQSIFNSDPSVLGFEFLTTPLTTALGVQSQTPLDANVNRAVAIRDPDLRPWRYLDFVSEKLTYNQDLKDSSTAPINRDVLCRWYMSWDNQAANDGYGFPIEMGYEPFRIRRIFNPPKQIKWNDEQPIGQLNFQVYGNNSYVPVKPVAVDGSVKSNWLMTLQASEN